MQLPDVSSWHHYFTSASHSAPKLLDRFLAVGVTYLDPLVSTLPEAIQSYLRPDPPVADYNQWYISIVVAVASLVTATAFIMSRYSPRAFQSPRASRDLSQDFSYISPEDVPGSMSSSTASRSRRRPRTDDYVSYVIQGRKHRLTFPRNIFQEGTLEIGDVRKEIAWVHKIRDEKFLRLERSGLVLDDDADLCHQVDVPIHDGLEDVNDELLVFARIMNCPEQITNFTRAWRRDDYEKARSATSPRSSTRVFRVDPDIEEPQHSPRETVRQRRPSDASRRKRPSGPSESMPNLGRSSPRDSPEHPEYSPGPSHAFARPRAPTGPSRPAQRPYEPPVIPTAPRNRRHSQSEDAPLRKPAESLPNPTPPVDPGAASTPFEKFLVHEKHFYDEIMPMIDQFLASPPPDSKEFEKERTRLNELITRTCEQNDGFEFKGGNDGRAEKRLLTKTALDAGRKIDSIRTGKK